MCDFCKEVEEKKKKKEERNTFIICRDARHGDIFSPVSKPKNSNRFFTHKTSLYNNILEISFSHYVFIQVFFFFLFLSFTSKCKILTRVFKG